MAWQVKFRPSALKELSRLPSEIQTRILDYLETQCKSPRAKGRAMKVGKNDPPLWRYRIGQYRVVSFLRDKDKTILVLRVGHRGKVYRGSGKKPNI